MKNIRLTIEYNGTEYSGWQSQADQPTIQDAITEAIFKVTGIRANLIGAGRTDAGVHALGQVANFKIEHDLEPERYRQALNYHLPNDIRVWESVEAHPDFHARFDARFRRYRYLIGEAQSALYRYQRWHCPDLDIALLRQAAAAVTGEHDFSAFCVVASRKDDNRCRIDHSKWRQIGPLLVFEIRGDRFLHSMVRSLVGAMANLARVEQDRNPRNLTLSRFKDILRDPGDERIEFTAPAHGLYLVSVGY